MRVLISVVFYRQPYLLYPELRTLTAFLGFYDPHTGSLRYSSGGHEPALLVRAFAIVADLPVHIAERELEIVRTRMGLRQRELEVIEANDQGPGNFVAIFSPRCACCRRTTGTPNTRLGSRTTVIGNGLSTTPPMVVTAKRRFAKRHLRCVAVPGYLTAPHWEKSN